MEAERQTSTTEKLHILHQVTPLSKNLAMLILIVFPFIGGWVGYSLAPDNLVEIERIVEVNSSSGEFINTIDNLEDLDHNTSYNGSKYITLGKGQYGKIVTSLLRKPEDSNFPLIRRKSTLTNGQYEITVSYPDHFNLDYWVRSANHWTKSMRVWVSKTTESESLESVLGINIHSVDYCNLNLCLLESQGDFAVGNVIWSYVGSSEYCGPGSCEKFEYLYKASFGDYFVYVDTTKPLHINDGIGDLSFSQKDDLVNGIFSSIEITEIQSVIN